MEMSCANESDGPLLPSPFQKFSSHTLTHTHSLTRASNAQTIHAFPQAFRLLRAIASPVAHYFSCLLLSVELGNTLLLLENKFDA